MDGCQPIPRVDMDRPATDTAPEPVTGRLSEPAPDTGVEWMYLIDRTTPGRLAICAHTGRWTIRHRLDLTVGRDFIVG